ncbi:MAG TPA: molybdopterin-dependent oxidoreductase [Vicinamibacterales bacterium]|jgi:anaerobic selenocysteine-containing dehydrogenase
MDRRNFIKLTAITGTSVTLASCGNPENQLIRFVPDDDITPGIAEWKPSVCPVCQAGCAVTVRVMDADVDTVRNGQAGVVAMAVAKKLEGQPKDPISQGGLCARGQASIQITYHPDRLTQPMKRTGARGTGEFQPLTWDAAIAELVGKLDALAAAGDQKSLVWLARPRASRRAALASTFLTGFGAPAPVEYEFFNDHVLRSANLISFGREQLPTIDIARSRIVIGFGADLLGTWNSPVAQSAAYGRMRQGQPQVRGKLVQVEPRMSLTGANADEWVPAKPGTEGVLALGLAHVILANKLRPGDSGRSGAAIDGWSGGLQDYAPAQVEKITGVAAKRIERLARELVEFHPAVAVIAGAPLAHTNGLFNALAVNALNGLLGAVEQPGGVFFTPGAPKSAATRVRPDTLTTAKVLLLDDANPLFAMPAAMQVREALSKIPFIASFGSFIDDSSAFADLILPDHSFLESWVDVQPESGSIEAVSTSAGPVMKPLYQTRATADVLIEIAGKLKTPVTLPWKTAEDVSKSAASAGAATPAAPSAISHQPSAIKYAEPAFAGDAAQFPFHFLPYASQAFGDGSTAHLPWLQELPDPITSAMWSSWVELNPQTAERLNIAQGDLVDVTSPAGVVRAPAMIFPGIAPDVVAMPVGQGHEQFTRYASKRGVNPIAILAPQVVAEANTLAWAATRVRIARAGDADGSLIMFAGEMRERPQEGETR